MKYIDADKLIAKIKELNLVTTTYDEQVAFNNALAMVVEIIDSLEEPVCEELEEAADKRIRRVVDAAGHPGWDWTTQDIADAFKAGAGWQEKRWENNRLMAQENATEEECQREMDFVDNHIKKHHRIPTFSDAINYGIKWQKEQMMKGAVEGEVIKTDKHTSIRYKSFYGTDRYFYGIADKQFKPGDKVRIIILPKEDEK